jgi:hypothetical protein
LEKLVDKGMTHGEIAEYLTSTLHTQVTRSAVSVALSRAGRVKRRGEDKATPAEWTVLPEHANKVDLHMLRVNKRLRDGKAVRDVDVERHRHWLQRLEEADAVVHYEPRSRAGFWWVPRRHGIDEGLVREPGLDDEGNPV